MPQSRAPITAAHVDRAKEILIERQDTHLDSLAERLREPRVHPVHPFHPVQPNIVKLFVFSKGIQFADLAEMEAVVHLLLEQVSYLALGFSTADIKG